MPGYNAIIVLVTNEFEQEFKPSKCFHVSVLPQFHVISANNNAGVLPNLPRVARTLHVEGSIPTVTVNRPFAGQGHMTMSISKVGCSTKWLPEIERA